MYASSPKQACFCKIACSPKLSPQPANIPPWIYPSYPWHFSNLGGPPANWCNTNKSDKGKKSHWRMFRQAPCLLGGLPLSMKTVTIRKRNYLFTWHDTFWYLVHTYKLQTHFERNIILHPGWQKLRERGSGAPRKVRVFYERKDLQHTLFCRET